MTRRNVAMRLPRWPAAAVALFAVSCGGGGPELHPVTGKVLFDGKPADGASVVFQPAVAGAGMANGTCGADGTFTLRTHPHGDGAVAGEYTVAVTWYPPDAREQANPKSKLPPRYADAAKSGLKATIKPGANTLEPFQLTK